MKKKITILLLLTLVSLNLLAAQKYVILKPFDVSGNNPQDTSKYWDYMKNKLSKKFIVLEQPVKKKHYPEIEISLQYINQFFFLNVFYSNGFVKRNYVSRVYPVKKDLYPIIDNLADFFNLLLNSINDSEEKEGKIKINIQTEPKSALVFVNGFYYGGSPVTVSKLNKSTKYSFLVYKFSYKPEVIKIEINKKHNGAIVNFKLDRLFEDHYAIIFNKIKNFIQPPKLIYKVLPKYSEVARMMGLQGEVVLFIGINDKGKAVTVEVKDPDPEKELLYDAAIVAGRKCTFTPAVYKGIRLKYVTLQVTYKFNLIN
ncbi:TonB family protein [bacterium]|nr:TonB family protein [bacterium]